MKAKYIFNHVFVIGLLVLMLNDHLLKGMFGNWFTGKLSDFTGILILPMFIAFLFKWNSNKSIVLTVLFFVFWKSSLSQGFIDSFNALGILNIGRVVDYSDFLSFLILPFSKYVLDHVERFEIKIESKIARELSLASLVVSSFVILTATSVSRSTDVVGDISDCCSLEPISEKVGNGIIYLPTVFTPDDNNLNEIFSPLVDTNIIRIDTFMIFQRSTGDTVYSKFDYNPWEIRHGYTGFIKRQLFADHFNFKIAITSKDGVSRTFNSSVCSLPCADFLNAEVPDSLGNCAFPVQFQTDVGYDETISPGELIDCFQ